MTYRSLHRRELLRWFGQGLALAPFASVSPLLTAGAAATEPPVGQPYQGTDDQLLDEIQKATFQFFWNETNPNTGQIRDRAFLKGGDTRTIASIAATGFGLSSLCIGDARGFEDQQKIAERVRVTLRFLWNKLPHEHGFYYHFSDMNTGARRSQSEVSSIDTSLLLCGVL